MKQSLTLLLGLTIAFNTCLAVQAAPVGLPADLPAAGKYIFGIEANSLQERKLFDEKLGTFIVKADSKQFLAKAVYGLSDRMAGFIKLGQADALLEDPNAAANYNHGGEIAWGLGGKMLLYEDIPIDLRLIGEAQYFNFSPGDAETSSGTRTAKWSEFQFGGYALLTKLSESTHPIIEPFTVTATSFYVGAKYSDVSVDWSTRGSSGTLDADTNLGFFAGVDFTFNDKYTLSLEGRFKDEQAMTIGLNFNLY